MSFISPHKPRTLDDIEPGTRVWTPVCMATLFAQDPLQRLESSDAWTTREEALQHFWFRKAGGEEMPEVWLVDMLVEDLIRRELPKKGALLSSFFAPLHCLEWLDRHGLPR